MISKVEGHDADGRPFSLESADDYTMQEVALIYYEVSRPGTPPVRFRFTDILQLTRSGEMLVLGAFP